MPAFFARRVDTNDVWMIERGERLCFSKKSLKQRFVAGKFFRQKFQGDLATKRGLFGQEYFSHAAFADRFGNAKVAELSILDFRSRPFFGLPGLVVEDRRRRIGRPFFTRLQRFHVGQVKSAVASPRVTFRLGVASW